MLLRNLGEVYKKGLCSMSVLYNRIASLCADLGVSITTMCKESGTSRASLSDLKVGRKQNLSADTLSKIATYFNVSVDFLLGKEKTPTESDERDILDDIDVAFYGDYKELTEDDKETLRAMARVMRDRQRRKGQGK